MDPLAGDFPSWSPYNYVMGNPVSLMDPDGRQAIMDNYYIHNDGLIEVERTDDDSDSFYLETEGGYFIHVATLDKNESDLIRLPDIAMFTLGEDTFGFHLKEGHAYRSYTSGEAVAALIGAVSMSGVSDLTVVGFSESDGTSPTPSKSHVNGRNGDFRYLRIDQSGAALYINENPNMLDQRRQNIFNEAMYVYGWKDLRAYRYIINGDTLLPSKSTHLVGHWHHLHVQGFRPNVKSLN